MSVQGVSTGNAVRDVQLPASGHENAPRESKPAADKAVQVVQTSQNLKVAEHEGASMTVADKQVIKSIDRALKSLEGPQTSVEMKVHEATRAVSIKVVNKETGEVIREIPPEKTLDLVAKMMEIAGLLVDERV